MRAAHVDAATIPVAGRFRRAWYALTAASVCGPNAPSAVIPRAFWSAVTADPVEPLRRVVLAYAASGLVEVGAGAGAGAGVGAGAGAGAGAGLGAGVVPRAGMSLSATMAAQVAVSSWPVTLTP